MNITYRQVWQSIGLALLLPLGLAAAADQPLLFTADYRASYAGFSGDVRMQLIPAKNPNEYTYRVTTQARGLARLLRPGMATEEARFRVDDGRIWPLRYTIDDGTKQGDDDMAIEFDWDNKVANSVYEKTPQTLELEPDIHDRLTTDLLVMQSLSAGTVLDRFRIAEKNTVRDYELTYRGEESIEVPAGRFDTVKYLRQRVGSSRSTLVWFAPAAHYLPVRLEQLKRGKTMITTVATDISLGAL